MCRLLSSRSVYLQIFNEYLQKLKGPVKDVEVCELIAMEDWAYEMLPKPVYGLIVCMSLSDKILKLEKSEADLVKKEEECPGVWFTRQTIPNACGPIALLHCLFNLPKGIIFEEGPLLTMKTTLENNSSEAKAKFLQGDDALRSVHEDMQSKGDTAPPPEEKARHVQEHFVAIVNIDNKIYQLDGRKTGPIFRGEISHEKEFLGRAMDTVKLYMNADPECQNFAILPLCHKQA